MGRSSRISMFLLLGVGFASCPVRAAMVPVWIKTPSARFVHDLAEQHRRLDQHGFVDRHRDFGFDSIVAGVGPFVGGPSSSPGGAYPVRPYPVRAQEPCIRPLLIVIDQAKTPAVDKPRVLYGAPPCGESR